MNAERLHAIAKAIQSDLLATNALDLLKTLAQKLQNQVDSPQEASHQKAVADILEELLKALESAPSETFPPTWKEALKELGGESLFGAALAGTVREIFARNQITPAVAREEVLQIRTRLQGFGEAIDELVRAFVNLHIGAEELEPGEAELGMLIPRILVDNKLENLATELKEDDRIFGVFSELATGSRPGFEIHAISSSDFSVFLGVDPATAACIALAVERIITLYKNLLEIRKLRRDLERQGLSEEALKPIESHAENVMDEGIEALIPELLDQFYKNTEGGRQNELKIELKYSLSKIANRIDRGFNIEVRVAPAPPTDEEPADGKQKEFEQIITNSAPTLQFLRAEGRPILRLNERPVADEPKEGDHKKEKKK